MKSTNQAIVVPIVLKPHDNADTLSIISVDLYTVVVRTEDWKDKKFGVYIPPDNIVDTTRPEFAFLATPGRTRERIKAKKLRGVISFGLLIPAPEGSQEGDDLTEVLGIEHYEPELAISLKGECVCGPPGVIAPKYDVDAARKYARKYIDGELVYISEKVHGCLHADTLVSTIVGDIRICDIETGCEVLSYNEYTKNIEIDVVLNKFVSQDNNTQWILLEFDNGFFLKCTVDHLIMTNRGWVKANELIENDEILKL